MELGAQLVSGVEKGLPDETLPLGEIRKRGWKLLNGDIPLPAMVLKREELDHNIATMQAYCDRHGAWLAPHGKTPMAPQLFAQQLQAGAWAITVANVAQLQVCRAFGLHRVLLANELATDYAIRYVAEQLRNDPGFELYVLVDSLEGVRRLTEGLRRAEAKRPLRVLAELGLKGGRTGVREVAELRRIAEAVLRVEPVLWLAGVEGYEGVAYRFGATEMEREAEVDSYLRRFMRAAGEIQALVPARKPFLVSAGGSIYFDRVIRFLGARALPAAQLVLRPGSYVTHDHGLYERSSPMGPESMRYINEGRLRPALEIWSAVLSKPEPGLAILGMGRRDVATDADLPIPKFSARNGEVASLGAGYNVTGCNDQHAFLRLPAEEDLRVGDLVGCGISHPCTSVDKWRILLVVDSARTVIGAVRTFF